MPLCWTREQRLLKLLGCASALTRGPGDGLIVWQFYFYSTGMFLSFLFLPLVCTRNLIQSYSCVSGSCCRISSTPRPSPVSRPGPGPSGSQWRWGMWRKQISHARISVASSSSTLTQRDPSATSASWWQRPSKSYKKFGNICKAKPIILHWSVTYLQEVRNPERLRHRPDGPDSPEAARRVRGGHCPRQQPEVRGSSRIRWTSCRWAALCLDQRLPFFYRILNFDKKLDICGSGCMMWIQMAKISGNLPKVLKPRTTV